MAPLLTKKKRLRRARKDMQHSTRDVTTHKSNQEAIIQDEQVESIGLYGYRFINLP